MIEALGQAKESVGKLCHLLARGCPDRTLQTDPDTGRELDLCAHTQVPRVAHYKKLAEYGCFCPSSRGQYKVESRLVPRSKYDKPLEVGTIIGFCYFRRSRLAIENDYLGRNGHLQKT